MCLYAYARVCVCVCLCVCRYHSPFAEFYLEGPPVFYDSGEVFVEDADEFTCLLARDHVPGKDLEGAVEGGCMCVYVCVCGCVCVC